MGKTITITSTKGGAGKTTIARLLLLHAMRRCYKVAAIDADLNQRLIKWGTRFSVPVDIRGELNEDKIGDLAASLEETNDLVVIDTAGAANQTTLFAIGSADLVLVPMQLSDGDVDEAISTMARIRAASKMIRRDIPARIVLTGFEPRTSVAKFIVQQLATLNLPETKARLNDLIPFVDMTHNGFIAVGSKADLQASALFDEVVELVGFAHAVPLQIASGE